MENVLISLTSQVLVELRRIAQSKGITRAELLRRIIEDYLNPKPAALDLNTNLLLDPMKELFSKTVKSLDKSIETQGQHLEKSIEKSLEKSFEKFSEDLQNLKGKLQEDTRPAPESPGIWGSKEVPY